MSDEAVKRLRIWWRIGRKLDLDILRSAGAATSLKFWSSGPVSDFPLAMSPSSSSSSLVAELDTASKKPKFLVLRADPTVGGEDGNLRGRSRAEDIVTNSVKVKRSKTMMMAVWKAKARIMLVKLVICRFQDLPVDP